MHHLLGETTALDHETRDHPVKDGVVVEAAVHILQEVLAADRRLGFVQFDFDLAEAGIQQYMRRFFGGHQAGGEDD
ncbi:hypothetical protein D3C85_1299120 [compost metagenome]